MSTSFAICACFARTSLLNLFSSPSCGEYKNAKSIHENSTIPRTVRRVNILFLFIFSFGSFTEISLHAELEDEFLLILMPVPLNRVDHHGDVPRPV